MSQFLYGRLDEEDFSGQRRHGNCAFDVLTGEGIDAASIEHNGITGWLTERSGYAVHANILVYRSCIPFKFPLTLYCIRIDEHQAVSSQVFSSACCLLVYLPTRWFFPGTLAWRQALHRAEFQWVRFLASSLSPQQQSCLCLKSVKHIPVSS